MFSNYRSPKPVPVPSTSRRISKSGSVPNLAEMKGFLSPVSISGSPSGRARIVKHHHRKGPRHSSVVQRSTRENGLLHPGMLRFHRHALSVDEGGPYLRWVSFLNLRFSFFKLFFFSDNKSIQHMDHKDLSHLIHN